MKNIKVLLFATMTMLFLEIGNVYAQETVLIKGTLYGKYTNITTVLPDYKITENEIGQVGENEFLIALKKELDKWLKEGYVVTESSIASDGQFII